MGNEIKLSSSQIEKFKNNYGVNITSKNGKIYFQGEENNINKVKGVIERKEFIDKYKSNNSRGVNSGRISDQLESINLDKDYNRVGSNQSSNNNYEGVIEFAI